MEIIENNDQHIFEKIILSIQFHKHHLSQLSFLIKTFLLNTEFPEELHSPGVRLVWVGSVEGRTQCGPTVPCNVSCQPAVLLASSLTFHNNPRQFRMEN